YAPMATQVVAAYAITWLLLLSGVRGIWQRGSDASDAHALRDRTLVPPSHLVPALAGRRPHRHRHRR
ncbi:MAG TPA: hypothetical protein VG268_04705, partial [Streptosporangiaceae bacterium]|nr:hypothetical protein [Streptosporangiaceae bacterium]